jgi:hypothetical protein
MKKGIVTMVVLGAIALAALVYFEQRGLHAARMEMSALVSDNGSMGPLGPGPEPDADTSAYAAADYPTDIANSIPVPASTAPELRRGLANEIVLAGTPTAPRSRPAQPRGIAVPRHAADLTGRQIVPVPAQEDLLA